MHSPTYSLTIQRLLLCIQSNDFIRDIWAPRPIVSAGGYTRDIALEVAEEKGDIIAFGRPFISNVSFLPFGATR